ncbi:lytic transglycosylase domain-containing protein [Roseateles chitinivorans]|uniref:lytic transglycosylase domain-containing protein n=1 Tax=Roseateles chitinivorans TaxID=2917965 RepID=UPI003D67FEBD
MKPAAAGFAHALALAAAMVLSAVALPARAQQATAGAKDRPSPRADASRFDRCFLLAGERYGVSPLLLKAVARQESGLNPSALNRNANGSTDIGLMQINSSWLPVLARHGVQEADLRVPCANILVGAWILGSNFRAMGTTADALGAYNARDPAKRLAYARQVLRHYASLRTAVPSAALSRPSPPTPTPMPTRPPTADRPPARS